MNNYRLGEVKRMTCKSQSTAPANSNSFEKGSWGTQDGLFACHTLNLALTMADLHVSLF